ncbi:DUF1178 family protein [Aureimonas mangrovi]|uniref:DUF1178 family protein n=1 Tax=Aureimonas mangrovi TaxID=2758041 RepID=UPI00163D53D4|nr:DUF1178 family protein [Aureimonas mangrovi]
MIHFNLRCEPAGHTFDGWFRSGDDFERQAKAGLVECPACGATHVAKALMAPAVKAGRETSAPLRAQAEPVAGGPASEKLAALHAKMVEIAREVRANADNVGRGFAEEARRIHFGEAEERRIYGEASPEEIRGLVEDGVPAFPLPALPEDKH